ncbi:MAG: sigma 54-interacting transcriptional regulator [Planctomycetota bacterium]|nr:sigma 54-interacting transcriptional regulator [Planctomycetota bacterium]
MLRLEIYSQATGSSTTASDPDGESRGALLAGETGAGEEGGGERRGGNGELTRVFESDNSPVFLGRDQSMDLVLDDPLVSRQHAVIICRGRRHVIQDVGGRNPIRVNDQPVVSHVLRQGDVVSLGNTRLVFRSDGEGPSGVRAADEDLSPTVVNARESLLRFREPTKIISTEDTDPFQFCDDEASSSRSRRNLRILQNFSEVIRNLPDRRKLLEAALHTAFDHLDVKRGFIGFFPSDGGLEVAVERHRGSAQRGLTYSRSIVERVRKEAVAVLFSDQSDTLSGGRSMADAKSVVLLKIKSAMCLPLFRSDQVCGVLYVDNRELSESFSQDDFYFANVLSHLISLALEKEELYQRISEENVELRTILEKKHRFIGSSRAISEVKKKIKKVAAFDTTVLIIGDSGTGKELVARSTHDRSPRRGKAFVAVNCAAIPETLLESELFGYAPRSGISGSDPKGRAGKFELADGGTLFLDEIGDISLSTQAKILRVLEDRIVNRLGATEGKQVDLRILAATNKALAREVEAGRCREDLYDRLKVFQIELPPLREHRDDILPLAQHFLGMHRQEGRGPVELSPRSRELLLAYHWPGNCRELRHAIEQAVLMSNRRTIYPEDLPRELRRDDNPPPFSTLSDVEAQHVARVLQSVNWNKRRAAEMLGINRSTLYEKIRLYRIERPVDEAVPGDDQL